MGSHKRKPYDRRRLQALADLLHLATGASVALLTPEGKPVVSAGWNDICRPCQATGRAVKSACRKTRAAILNAARSSEDLTALTICPLGLTEAATVLTHEGTCVAYLVIGQFHGAHPCDDRTGNSRPRAKKHGFAYREQRADMRKLPVIPSADARRILKSMADLIAPLPGLDSTLTSCAVLTPDGNSKAGRDIAADQKRATSRSPDLDQWITALDAMNDAVALIDAKGKILQCNRAMTTLMGKPLARILGRSCHSLVHGTKTTIPDCPHVRAFQTLRRETMEMTIGERSYRVTVDPIKDEAGRMTSSVHIFSDISKSKRAENSLRESEARFRSLIQNSSDLIVILNRQGLITYETPSLQHILGYSPGYLIGRSPLDFIHPDDLSSTANDLEGVFSRNNDGLPTEFRFRHADGVWVYLEAVGNNLLDYEGINGVVITARDITERKRAEDEIARTSRRYRDLVETTNEFFWEMNAEWSFSYASPKAKDFLGFEPGELLHKPALDFMSRGEVKREWNAVRKKLEGGHAVNNVEHAVVQTDGRTIILESSILPIMDRDRAITGYRGVTRDITERKRLENELAKVQKLDSIGMLAGGIAHDYNNLLTAILGYIGLCKTSITRTDRNFELIEKAEKAALLARDLTKQLITFSRGGMPLRRVMDIRELIEQTVKFSLSGSKLRPRYTLAPNLAPVFIDEDQMRQVIQNLVINAREAMHDNGELDVELANSVLEPDSAYSMPDGEYIRVVIRDHGKGIPPELLPKVFDPYFSTKALGSQKGMGLGLSICYSIVKKHGGGIRLDSTVGTGTTVSIFLPAAKP